MKLRVHLLFVLLVSCGTTAEQPAPSSETEEASDGSGGMQEVKEPLASSGGLEPSSELGGAPSGGAKSGGAPTMEDNSGGSIEGTGGELPELLNSCPGATKWLGDVPACIPGTVCDSVGETSQFTAWPCYVHDTETGYCVDPEASWGCCCHPKLYEGVGGMQEMEEQ